jgi:tartrate dehydratase alpha subunit/fumarate hydratase class I-like protein
MDRNELADKLDKIAAMAEWKQSTDAVRQAAAALRESEEWRRDAERYKWLTKNAYVGETCTHQGTVFEVHGCDREVPIDDDVDAAIDAARKEGV